MRLSEREHREGLRPARAGPEVAVLVVAGGDGDVQLAGARHELAARRDDDRRVVAEAVASLGALIERGVDMEPVSPATRAAKPWVAPPGRSSGSTPAGRRPARVDREVADSG